MDLTALKSKIGTIPTSLKRLANAELVEALIATWAIEFLRLRRVGGFRPVEVITISLLMVIVRHVIQRAGKRGRGEHHEVIVSRRFAQVDPVGHQRDIFDGTRWKRSGRTQRRTY